MNPVVFSRKSDNWATPNDLFHALDVEFGFCLDAAADASNAKCARWYGPGGVRDSAFELAWTDDAGEACPVWLNPPYSKCRAFIERASHEARVTGSTVVCLVPARTDTRWFHDHVWDRARHQPQPGVEVRFLKGRLTFGGAPAGAPFPSVVIVFRPVT